MPLAMSRLQRPSLLFLAALVPLLGAVAASVEQDPAPAAVLDMGGVQLDPAAGLISFSVRVEVRDDLLEYLLVAPHGAVHESMFVTGVDPEVLNASILALGLQPGQNAKWVAKDPAPTREELRAGVRAYDVQTPSGDGLYLYLGWREGDETYWYRVEDMLRDLDRLRTMRRHPWVFLGSRMIKRESAPEREVFAASLEGNLINMPFFANGTTLITSAIPEAEKQNIWLPNAWLLPERGSQLLMVASKERLAQPPSRVLARLPELMDGKTTEVQGGASPNAGHVPQKNQTGGGR